MTRFLGASLLTILLTAPAAAEDLVIGSIMPLTGGLQSYGPGILSGFELAVVEANANGGLMGKTVVIKVGDSRSTAQPGVEAATKLIELDGAVGIIGCAASSCTIAVATSTTVPKGIPMISPSATAATVSTIDDKDLVFRTTLSDALQGVGLAQIAYEAGERKVAVIHKNDDYGVGIAQAFGEAFQKLGGEVTMVSAYEANAPSYRAELQQLHETGATALGVFGYPDDGGVDVIRQALEEGYFSKMFMPDAMRNDVVPQSLGTAVDGFYGTSAAAVESPQLDTFLANYEAHFGKPVPHAYITSSYDAGMIMMLAIAKANSTEGAAIHAAIREVANAPGEVVGPGEYAKALELLKAGKDINYEGASGPVDFDERGDVKGVFELWEYRDGKIVSLKTF